MRRSASSALTTAAALAATGVLLGGCGLLPSGGEPSAGRSEGPVDLLGHDTSDMAPLTVHLVVPEDAADPSFAGRAFGCGDLLVPVQTVPSGGVDRADAALDFLFDDDQGAHGDPTLLNEVESTAETLTPTGHRRDGDTEVFTFSGTVTADGACAAERIRAQLAETARSQTDAPDVRLEVDGRDLDDVLGLAPLALGEPTAGGGAEPTQGGGDAGEGRVTTPPEPPTDASTGWNGADATATTAPLDAVPDTDGIDVGTSDAADAGTGIPGTAGASTAGP